MEFALIAPILLMAVLLTVQLALIYQAKIVLNYATFEAARSGAVNHAQLSAIRRELGLRLAPLVGGQANAAGGLQSIAISSVLIDDAINTDIRVINPPSAAFDDWGVVDSSSQRRFIPNSHLVHQDQKVGPLSGLTIQDANILRIKVVHGFRLKVPLAGAMLAQGMLLIDKKNSDFYHRNRIPLNALATVRMQSEAWEEGAVNVGEATNSSDQEVSGSQESGAGSAPDGNGPGDASDIPGWEETTIPEHGDNSSQSGGDAAVDANSPDCLPAAYTHRGPFDGERFISVQEYLELF